jgi:leucyl aminopeptidase
MMDVASVYVASPDQPEAGFLIAGCFEGEPPAVDGLPEAVRGALGRLAARPGWDGRDEQVVETDAGPDGPVVCLYGLGPRQELTPGKLGRWLTRAADEARIGGLKHLVVLLPSHPATSGATEAERIARQLALTGYRYDRYHSEIAEKGRIERIGIVPPAGEEEIFRSALAVARSIVEAVAFSRDLGNTPPNEASPVWIEERAREMVASRGITLTSLDEAELRRRGMGGILAVGAGSANEPRLLRLEWGDSGPIVALVGKGITFDSGGISIKPAADMDLMKYDKCGACAVLGIVRAVADLGLPVRLRAYVALAENMLDGSAYRPGDIVRCYNGKTVEITNTDAEGRVALADALSWAAEEKPDHLLEYSTLTGSCVVALGHLAGGLFTPHDGLAGELLAAGEGTGERLWRLPMWPEYLEEMKAVHADLRNSAGRWGGASMAAAFLAQFVGDLESWAHLDIAGVAYIKPENESRPGGATGFGIASTVAWLRRLVS